MLREREGDISVDYPIFVFLKEFVPTIISIMLLCVIRPRWALIDKSYMHNTWRASQSSYHKFRTDNNLLPSDHLILLVEDLLDLSVHNYETVRL